MYDIIATSNFCCHQGVFKLLRLFLSFARMPEKPYVITADLEYLQFTFQDIQREVSSSWTHNCVQFPDFPFEPAQLYEIRDIDQVLNMAARVIIQDLAGLSIGCVETVTYYALLNVLPTKHDIHYIRPSRTRIEEKDLGNPVQLGRAVLCELAKESLCLAES